MAQTLKRGLRSSLFSSKLTLDSSTGKRDTLDASSSNISELRKNFEPSLPINKERMNSFHRRILFGMEEYQVTRRCKRHQMEVPLERDLYSHLFQTESGYYQETVHLIKGRSQRLPDRYSSTYIHMYEKAGNITAADQCNVGRKRTWNARSLVGGTNHHRSDSRRSSSVSFGDGSICHRTRESRVHLCQETMHEGIPRALEGGEREHRTRCKDQRALVLWPTNYLCREEGGTRQAGCSAEGSRRKGECLLQFLPREICQADHSHILLGKGNSDRDV